MLARYEPATSSLLVWCTTTIRKSHLEDLNNYHRIKCSINESYWLTSGKFLQEIKRPYNPLTWNHQLKITCHLQDYLINNQTAWNDSKGDNKLLYYKTVPRFNYASNIVNLAMGKLCKLVKQPTLPLIKSLDDNHKDSYNIH